MVQSTTGQQMTTAGSSTRPRGTEPHYPHKQQTQPRVCVCVCVTGIFTDRNEHNYTQSHRKYAGSPQQLRTIRRTSFICCLNCTPPRKHLCIPKYIHTHSYSLSWDVHSQRLRFHEIHSHHFSTLKVTVHPNMKILPSFTHPHVIQQIVRSIFMVLIGV